ncbi:MAG TPA: thioesterase domain-containing protein [Actinophytocola sp.]|uniref:thioesterase domain-containing protein n=1 Tax=Actinophytocola sp. TaxID=1872138 RepID=UPI002DB58EBC|nr:thioesterase domain-containing protein [Actinophytocola sp.]HEU5471320.1 thioesterase domain-containing protein [Actinophytocola sp.]
MTNAPGRLIPIARRKDRPACVMIPGAGGGLAPYLRLGSYLGQTYNVYAVRAAGLVPDEPPEGSVPAMAEGVLRALEPDGLVPDVVFGWSMGGTVAWEVCATLAERGHRPALVMVDCSPFRLVPDPVRDKGILDVIVGMLGPRPDQRTLDRVTATFHAHSAALAAFESTRGYDGPVLLLVCAGESDLVDRGAALDRWRSLAPELRVGTLATDHFRVFDPEHLPALSAAVGGFLGLPVEVAS